MNSPVSSQRSFAITINVYDDDRDSKVLLSWSHWNRIVAFVFLRDS